MEFSSFLLKMKFIFDFIGPGLHLKTAFNFIFISEGLQWALVVEDFP